MNPSLSPELAACGTCSDRTCGMCLGFSTCGTMVRAFPETSEAEQHHPGKERGLPVVYPLS